MMKFNALIFVFALFACLAFAQDVQDGVQAKVDELKEKVHDILDDLMSNDEVDRINKNQRTWEAGIIDAFKDKTIRDLKKMLSMNIPADLKGKIRPSDEIIKKTVVVDDASTVQGRLLATIPTSFDSRTRWPGCVGPVRNQKTCGACWAFSSIESFEDRLCVAGRSSPMVPRSAQYLLDCAPNQQGCNGGYPNQAWNFLVTDGAPSEACYPYLNYKNTCSQKCATTQLKAKRVVTYSSIDAVKNDLMTYGPVVTWMAVYQDLYYYKSGVYQPTTNSLLGYHGVKVIGWGTDSYYGNYWIVQNSWGTSWGEKGFFRIKAGTCILDQLDHFVSGWV